MASGKKSSDMRDERTPYSTDGSYPDLNTPLNVTKAAAEPGPDVLKTIDGWEDADGVADPMGFISHLTGGKKGKK